MSDFVADPKKPDEQYFLGIDFSEDLGSEAIGTVDILDVNGFIDQTKNNNTDTVVYFWFKGGASGDSGEIVVTVEGTTGSIYQKTMLLRIV